MLRWLSPEAARTSIVTEKYSEKLVQKTKEHLEAARKEGDALKQALINKTQRSRNLKALRTLQIMRHVLTAYGANTHVFSL